ncbi:MAG: dienelactone hydrolase family protein [Actinomycetota bacterium]
MAEVLLFHHAQGLTAGCVSFADELRAAGHIVHVPDLYNGKTFDDLNEGVAHAESVGFDVIRERGRRAAARLPGELVYAGFSLGALPAQDLAQTRPGAKGAVIMHAAMQPSGFGTPWPDGVPLQVHTMDRDSWGDPDVARELSETLDEAEVFLYPGDRHLFTDESLADYDATAADLVMQRVLAFLDDIE